MIVVHIACSTSLISSLEMLNAVPSCCVVFQNEKILQVGLNAIRYYHLLKVKRAV